MHLYGLAAATLLASLMMASTAMAQPSGKGELSVEDPTLENGAYYDDLPFEAASGQTYDLTVTSDAFNPIVIVLGPDGKVFGENREAASKSATLAFTPTKAGTWTLRVTQADAGEGEYSVALIPRE